MNNYVPEGHPSNYKKEIINYDPEHPSQTVYWAEMIKANQKPKPPTYKEEIKWKQSPIEVTEKVIYTEEIRKIKPQKVYPPSSKPLTYIEQMKRLEETRPPQHFSRKEVIVNILPPEIPKGFNPQDIKMAPPKPEPPQPYLQLYPANKKPQQSKPPVPSYNPNEYKSPEPYIPPPPQSTYMPPQPKVPPPPPNVTQPPQPKIPPPPQSAYIPPQPKVPPPQNTYIPPQPKIPPPPPKITQPPQPKIPPPPPKVTQPPQPKIPPPPPSTYIPPQPKVPPPPPKVFPPPQPNIPPTNPESNTEGVPESWYYQGYKKPYYPK